MSAPLVSVVMPVFNEEVYLFESLASLAAQSYSNIEVIVVDDHSDDRSAEVVQSFESELNLKLIAASGRGTPSAINQGVQVSRGQFIARQDGDDISHARRIEKQVEFISEVETSSVVGSWTRVMDHTGEDIGVQYLDDGSEFPTTPGDIAERLPFECCIVGASVLMRRDWLEQVGGYRPELVFAEDYDLWLRAIQSTEISAIPEYLYTYRRHMKSMWRSHKQVGKVFTAIAQQLYWERNRVGIDVLQLGGHGAFIDKYWGHLEKTLSSPDLNYAKDRLGIVGLSSHGG